MVWLREDRLRRSLALRSIRLVDEILRNLYKNPDHGNKADPVDELVYIVLSRRTRAAAYEGAYEELKRRYPSWDLLLGVPVQELERVLRPSGMSHVKATTLKDIMVRLRCAFGCVTLEPARKWSNLRLLGFLTTLPGVSLKTALCVMMYSMQRRVFPADSNVIRVCYRLGITGHDNKHHKRAQQDLSTAFPDDIRYSLHVNMIAHGRYVCRPIPKCDRCEIRRFCEYYRRQQRSRNAGRHVFTVADVFSGAGGMTAGFVHAGFKVALAVDSDPNAMDTLELNNPAIPAERIILADVRRLSTQWLESVGSRRHVNVVVGGPPSQGYSMAGARTRTNVSGRRFIDDPRYELYREFLRVVSCLRPEFVVMENVPGILSAKDGLYVRQILQDYARLRPPYLVQVLVLNALDFGVPQNRRRVFFVGTRNGRNAARRLDALVAEVQHAAHPAASDLILWTAIEDLPRVRAGEGAEVMLASPPRGRRTKYRSLVCDGSKLIFNHKPRTHNPRDLKLYDLLQPGETGWHAIVKYNRPDLMVYRNDVWLDKYRRLREDEPSPTVVAHLARMGNMFIHPRIPRGITVREAARIQSFSDDFVFLGTFGRQFRMIGNAVPPLVSEAIGRSILWVLKEEKRSTGRLVERRGLGPASCRHRVDSSR